MPELPEVELVVRSLQRLIVGRSIVRAEILRPRLIPGISTEEFGNRLKGRTIEGVSRRGKFILATFDDNVTLITHLRMSGRFGYLTLEKTLPKFTHAIFYLDNEMRLIFSDQRHFGMMKIMQTNEVEDSGELSKLGPEPFGEKFTTGYLRSVLASSRRTIKETLLDQSRVVGLGNIYAAEVLFSARVRPTASAANLSRTRVDRIRGAIIDILGDAVANGSTLNVDPENIDGSYYGGGFEQQWAVYDRENDPCHVCGSRIRRITQGGRSTYFCPKCQRT
jgi:formamidopyrimidine-DNA glycosylase